VRHGVEASARGPGALARLGRLLAIALLAGLAVPWPLAGVRAQEDSLEAAKRQELEALSRQAKEKRAQAGALRGQETRAMGELKRTERQLLVTRKRLRTLRSRRARLDDQLELTRANLERSVATLGQRRSQLARRLRHIYMEGPARELEFLVSTRSFAGLMMRWDFLQMVAEQDRLLVESVQTEKEKVEANQERLEGNLREVSANAQRSARESDKLSGLRQSRASTVRQIQSKREEYEAAAAELERSARAIQGLLARLERSRQAETDRARGQGRNPQPYSGDFARGQGQLDWPVRGAVVGHLGIETHPRFGTQVRNDGMDIAAPVGTAVRAVAKGRVDFANEDYEGVGGMVVLNHGDGYYTIYSHLSEVNVSTGIEVQPGAIIGRSGETGSLKGPVLHFEVRKGSTPLNPESWLR
jgi:septal ring factor EnvC (AmiA/AmiB activator)